MIRFLLSLGLFVAAGFAPWRPGLPEGARLARPVLDCVLAERFRPIGPCAPQGGFEGALLLAILVLALASAALNLAGSLPAFRRHGGGAALAAGVAGVLAVLLASAAGGALRWGVAATGLFGALLAAAGAVRIRTSSRAAAGSTGSTRRSLRS